MKQITNTNIFKVLNIVLLYAINSIAYFLVDSALIFYILTIIYILFIFAFYDFEYSFIVLVCLLVTGLFNNIDYPLSYTTTVNLIFAGVYTVKYLYSTLKKKLKLNCPILLVNFSLVLLSFVNFNPEKYKAICVYILLLMVIYLCFVYSKQIDLHKTLKWMINTLLVILLISCICLFFEKSKVYVLQDNYRFMSFFANPNALQINCMMCLSFLIVLFFKNKLSNCRFCLLAIPFIVSGILSKSKAFILLFCLLVLIFIICLFFKDWKKGVYSLPIFIIAGGIIFLLFKENVLEIIDRFTMFNYDNILDTLTTGRFSIWQEYLKVWTSSFVNILFGVGVTKIPQIVNIGAHSSYIELICAYGLLGTTLIVVLIWLYIRFSNNKKNFKFINFLPILIFLLLAIEESVVILRLSYLLVLCGLFVFDGTNTKTKIINSSSKTKILVWGMTNVAGGIESVIMNYYRNIDRSLLEFYFIQNFETMVYSDEIINNSDKIIKITPRKKNYFKYKQDLRKIFENYKIDCVWANTCSLSNIDCLKIAKEYGVKKRIIHAHSSKNMGSKLTYILHLINKLIIKEVATDYWSCSKVASSFFYNKNILNNSNYKIINNAINTEKFQFRQAIRDELRKTLKIEQDTLVVGHVGRFQKEKNHEFLVDVFDKIHNINKNSKLLLVGDGDLFDTIKIKIKEKQLEDNVIMLGARKDIAELLCVMDIFVFPSFFEGLSVSLVEAQTSGLTVFTSDTVIEDTKLTTNYYNISIKETVQYWADYILKTYSPNYERINSKDAIVNSGFDITIQAKDMLEFFNKNNKEG